MAAVRGDRRIQVLGPNHAAGTQDSSGPGVPVGEIESGEVRVLELSGRQVRTGDRPIDVVIRGGQSPDFADGKVRRAVAYIADDERRAVATRLWRRGEFA